MPRPAQGTHAPSGRSHAWQGRGRGFACPRTARERTPCGRVSASPSLRDPARGRGERAAVRSAGGPLAYVGMPTPSLRGQHVLIVIAPADFRDEELLQPKAAFEAEGAVVEVASTTDPDKYKLGIRLLVIGFLGQLFGIWGNY